MTAHFIYAMPRPWKRKPAGYEALHAQLAAECAADRKPSRVTKQDRHRAASELYKILGDTP